MNFKELPCPIPDMVIFRATHYPYQFVIVCETRMGEKHKDWTGYTATYRNVLSKKLNSTRIEGIWNNKDDAIQACKNQLIKLKNK